MYTFVFLWTPALQPHGEDIPFGMIFSIFMVACMAGSAMSGKLLSPNSGYRVEKYMQVVFLVAAATMFVPVMFHLDSVAEDDSREGQRACMHPPSPCCLLRCCLSVGGVRVCVVKGGCAGLRECYALLTG